MEAKITTVTGGDTGLMRTMNRWMVWYHTQWTVKAFN